MSKNNKKKVIIGMSGGVDSSVSAWLLQKQGYHVEGVFMKNWEEDDNENYCSASIDIDDAKSVCNILNIKLHTINFSYEYWNNVFLNFIDEYKKGNTPNPDILCNKEIKFKTFLDFAIKDLNADFIATGHYVRHVIINGKNQLFRNLNNIKDQSYFLYTLSHKQISRCLFPIETLSKSNIRYIASKLGFKNSKKKSSTGICFIGKKKFKEFIKRYIPENPGIIMSAEGKHLGHHNGLVYYTLGQRKGICVGGIKNGNGSPWYVVDKDIKNNILIIDQGKESKKLMSIGFIANKLYWIDRKPFINSIYCTVKTRYRQQDIDCLIIPQKNGDIDVTFNKPISSVTPGQSAVFYLKEKCLGGGIIKSRKYI